MQLPDAETLCRELGDQLRPQLTPRTALVGIRTGGLWLAERLHAMLDIQAPLGAIDVSFYRDDYGSRGATVRPQRTAIPFEVAGAEVILIDDVLYTGRTTRAALNELFDFGRPARVDLAVLVDRGGRELPIAARYCAHTLSTALPSGRTLELRLDEQRRLSFSLRDSGR